MKQMIYNISKAAAMTITAIAFLLCACSREDVNQSSDGLTTTISLNIPMLSSSSRAPIEGSDEENAIHNLHVIILKQGAESIILTFDKDNFSNGKGTIEIKDVPVGQVEMYVIANEASLGKDYTDLKTLKDDVVDLGYTRKVRVLDENRQHFPKRGSEFPATGLPMSWMNKDQAIYPPKYDAENNIVPQNINVDLQRCVAKLKIIMQSTLSEEIVIKEMNFGTFFGDRLYLFQEQSLDVPDEAKYAAKGYTGLDITIPPNGEKILECYIYPSFAWKSGPSPYTIGFKTESVPYEPQAFVTAGGAINSIARNTQINITAKLSKPANVNISFEVVPWVEETVDVPSFN